MSVSARFGVMLAAVSIAFLVSIVGMYAPDVWQLVRALLLTAAIAIGLLVCAVMFSVHDAVEKLARDIKRSHEEETSSRSYQIDNMMLNIGRRHANMIADITKIIRPRVDEVLRDVTAANRAARAGENNNG